MIYRAKISVGEALTGTRLKITHLDGRLLDIPVNEIVQPGYQKCIPGHGMPLMDNPEKFGDLIVVFDVEYPKKLTTGQRSLIRQALVNSDEEKQRNASGKK